MLEYPPGGAWIPVDDLSVMILPQFWFEPWAYTLEDTVLAFDSPKSPPKQRLDFPPGGAWIPVDDRSEMKLPEFWLEPLANVFEDGFGVFSDEDGL